MSRVRVIELLREQISFGAKDLGDIPLTQRGNLSRLALEDFDEVLKEARGKDPKSKEVERLVLVSKMAIGDWGDGR